MGRPCLNCGKEIIVGKTCFPSELYEDLMEVEIHVECRRCVSLKNKIKRFTEERRELNRQSRELTNRIKTYKGLFNVVGNRDPFP